MAFKWLGRDHGAVLVLYAGAHATVGVHVLSLNSCERESMSVEMTQLLATRGALDLSTYIYIISISIGGTTYTYIEASLWVIPSSMS